MSRSGRVLAATAMLLVAEMGLWVALRFRPQTALLLFVPSALPWLLLLPGLWRGSGRSALWAVLLTAPYLAWGLMEVLANPGAKFYAAGQVLLAFAIFVAAIAHLRITRPRA